MIDGCRGKNLIEPNFEPMPGIWNSKNLTTNFLFLYTENGMFEPSVISTNSVCTKIEACTSIEPATSIKSL